MRESRLFLFPPVNIRRFNLERLTFAEFVRFAKFSDISNPEMFPSAIGHFRWIPGGIRDYRDGNSRRTKRQPCYSESFERVTRDEERKHDDDDDDDDGERNRETGHCEDSAEK